MNEVWCLGESEVDKTMMLAKDGDGREHGYGRHTDAIGDYGFGNNTVMTGRNWKIILQY